MWLANMAKPAIASFHNRDKRKMLEEELPKVAREGNVVELSRLLDSADERGADVRGFEEAKESWYEGWKQMRDIQNGQEDLREEAAQSGQQIASLIAVTVALVTTTVYLIGMFL